MAQIGAVFVFCSSCKILYFANSVHPKNATEIHTGEKPYSCFGGASHKRNSQPI